MDVLDYGYSPIKNDFVAQRIVNPKEKKIKQYGIRLIKTVNYPYVKIKRINNLK